MTAPERIIEGNVYKAYKMLTFYLLAILMKFSWIRKRKQPNDIYEYLCILLIHLHTLSLAVSYLTVLSFVNNIVKIKYIYLQAFFSVVPSDSEFDF